MSLLNEGFYPTPPEVIDQMVEPYVREYDGRRYINSVDAILEPSAGWGHIVKHLVSTYRIDQRRISCIEIEEEARHILIGEGFKVIDTDFLAYNELYNFSHIIMNPPFNMGVAHILKAWNILRNGHIACLLNANTIRNPNSRARRLLLQFIKDHGDVKFIGQPFLNAERPTDVECTIVWLHKEAPKGDDGIKFEGTFDHESRVNESDFSANPLAHPNIIKTLVAQYDAARRVLIEADKQQAQFRFYTKGIGLSADDKKIGMDVPLNSRIDALKAGFWKFVFDKTKIGQQVTSNYQDKFYQFAQASGSLAFSEANVIRVLEGFLINQGDIIQQCILEAFDLLTMYHKENRVHVEGWISNKSWKAAAKLVLPGMISTQYISFWSLMYQNSRKLTDIDKALCFLSRLKFEEIHGIAEAIEQHLKLIQAGKRQYDILFESTFFNIRIFKKGTIHLKVKDTDLWDRFNIAASQGKNWLPGRS